MQLSHGFLDVKLIIDMSIINAFRNFFPGLIWFQWV